jgi:hypothetical protein
MIIDCRLTQGSDKRLVGDYDEESSALTIDKRLRIVSCGRSSVLCWTKGVNRRSNLTPYRRPILALTQF